MKRYIEEFIKLKCAPDLMALGLFPNAKEITESMAAYNAVRKHVTKDFGNKNILIYVPGDGHVPRTGAVFAYRSAWSVYSVDPEMRVEKHFDEKIERLVALRTESQRFSFNKDFISVYGQVVIVMVHSHATIKQALYPFGEYKGILSIVTIPCCVSHDIPNKPYIGYQDTNIWSPKNTIKIWKDITA